MITNPKAPFSRPRSSLVCSHLLLRPRNHSGELQSDSKERLTWNDGYLESSAWRGSFDECERAQNKWLFNGNPRALDSACLDPRWQSSFHGNPEPANVRGGQNKWLFNGNPGQAKPSCWPLHGKALMCIPTLSSVEEYWLCIDCALAVHWLCIGCSLTVHWLCIRCALAVHWLCIGCALGTLERMVAVDRRPVLLHTENWVAMITAFGHQRERNICALHSTRIIDTRSNLQIPLEMRSVRKVDRFEYAARRCMDPNQRAIQYEARIRINSSRPFCTLLLYGGLLPRNRDIDV